MQSNSSNKSDLQKERKEIYREVVGAFEHKYGWLGRQAARELLMSAATWNLERYSNPTMRYRSHIMFAWEKGWVKTSLLTKMAELLGDELCSVMGKVTSPGIRGSVSSGMFVAPKPLKTPIVISKEFGETNFEDELLNAFLGMLDEGYTTVTLNKIASLTNSQRSDIEKRFDGMIQFVDENEFNIQTDFVFWGATYDPTKLEDNALRSRMNVITPTKPLDSGLVEEADKRHFNVSAETTRQLRREVKREKEMDTTFVPPSSIYENYHLNFRESRDVQSYMAARNWWGLDVNPEIMGDYLGHLKKSRRRSKMNDEELILDLIFDEPMTYDEMMEKTGFSKLKVYKILDGMGAKRIPDGDKYRYVVYSGDKIRGGDEDEEDDFLSGMLE